MVMKRTDGRRYLFEKPPWDAASWDGAEYEMLRRSAAMTFRERLEWLEAIAELAVNLKKSKRRSKEI